MAFAAPAASEPPTNVTTTSHANASGSRPSTVFHASTIAGTVVMSSSSTMRGLVNATYAETRSRSVGCAPGGAPARSPAVPGPAGPTTPTAARAAYQPVSAAATSRPQIAAPSARWSDTAQGASVV